MPPHDAIRLSLPHKTRERVERLVEVGRFSSMSQAMRVSMSLMLKILERRGDGYTGVYLYNPETRNTVEVDITIASSEPR